MMFTMDDPPLRGDGEAPTNIATEVVNSRKSWKRAKGERVWPPELEAALIEGLENYRPVDSRETRLLGRFPMRNRFLSNFILQKTGELRTAKQVGSRLQQLRDPRSGKRLMQLLSHNMHDCVSMRSVKHRVPSHGDRLRSQLPPLCCELSPLSPSSSSPNSPTTPADDNMPGPTSRTIVSIDILPLGALWSASSTSRSPSPQQFSDNTNFYESSEAAPGSTSSDGVNVFQPSPEPRPLWAIDPTVTFIGRSAIAATSFFSVILDGHVVHTDMVELNPLRKSPHEIDGVIFYRASLVPAYWNVICESGDPTRYQITQDVYSGPCPDLATTSVSDISGPKLFSAIYEFKYPSSVSVQLSQRTCTPKIFQEDFSPEMEISNHSDIFFDFLQTDCLLPPNVSLSTHDPQHDIFHDLVGRPDVPNNEDTHTHDSLAVSGDFSCFEAPPPPSISCLPMEFPNYII